MMNDQQLLRFSRHILLDEIGIEGQEKLLAAHALAAGWVRRPCRILPPPVSAA